jgi:CRP/FNR family transcriptional regulator
VIARLFHAGQTLGYLAYFAGRPYTGTAEAVTECRICFIDKAAVRTIVSRRPGVAQRFLGRIADNLSEAEDARLSASALPLRARLAELLLSVRERFGTAADDGTIALTLPLSRQDIAAMLGARPETLSRAIRELTEAGIAVFDGREVRIPDLDALIDEVED